MNVPGLVCEFLSIVPITVLILGWISPMMALGRMLKGTSSLLLLLSCRLFIESAK